MKAYRQSLVLELVDGEPIYSQEQLREQLKARGIDVTQATLSRDIRDLGLVKAAADGAYKRPQVGEAAVPADAGAVLKRVIARTRSTGHRESRNRIRRRRRRRRRNP